MYILDNNFKIYLPSTYNIDCRIDDGQLQDIKKDIIKKLSIIFGGCTSYDAFGGWYSEDKKRVINEHVLIIQCFTTSELLKKNFKNITAICKDIKSILKQEAISLEINNTLKFI